MQITSIKPDNDYLKNLQTLGEDEFIQKGHNLKSDIDKLACRIAEELGRLEALKDFLIEKLTTEGKSKTAKYDGIGYATLVKPRVFASYGAENEANVFEYLRSIGRGDLVKETVNRQSLSSFVSEKLELSEAINEAITYYLKQDLRFYQ